MSIDKDKIKHVSKLARISVDEKKIDGLTKDLSSIFKFIEQLNELDLIAADYILFDNFEVSAIKKGIDICKQKNYAAEIELSGGITLDNIDKYSGLNIQRISVGSLTHSVKAMDLSLLIVN